MPFQFIYFNKWGYMYSHRRMGHQLLKQCYLNRMQQCPGLPMFLQKRGRDSWAVEPTVMHYNVFSFPYLVSRGFLYLFLGISGIWNSLFYSHLTGWTKCFGNILYMQEFLFSATKVVFSLSFSLGKNKVSPLDCLLSMRLWNTCQLWIHSWQQEQSMLCNNTSKSILLE